jgi:hypothetical protein
MAREITQKSLNFVEQVGQKAANLGLLSGAAQFLSALGQANVTVHHSIESIDQSSSRFLGGIRP